MHQRNALPFLAGATFLQTFTLTLAKECSYTSYNDVIYYTCLSNQYCCGRSSCCYSNDYYYGVYDLWYFWFCLCFGIFICSLASGAYYRKRQMRGVQVAAIHTTRSHPGHHHGGNIRLMHGHGVLAGHGPGQDGIMHPPPRNVMVTTTAASGQPMYPPHGYYDEAPPNYPVFSTLGGPMYPAYAYMPPPPSYSSLTGPVVTVTTGTSPASTSPSTSSASSTASSALSGAGVPPVSA